MNTTELAVEIRPEKSSGLYGIWTHDLAILKRCTGTAKVMRSNPVRAWIFIQVLVQLLVQ